MKEGVKMNIARKGEFGNAGQEKGKCHRNQVGSCETFCSIAFGGLALKAHIVMCTKDKHWSSFDAAQNL